MKRFCLLLLLPIVCSASNEDSLFIRKISDEILTNGQAYENLRELTKKIGGRLAGSPQMVQAEKWAVAKMGQAGSDEVIQQECMVPHWVRGGTDEAWITSVDGKKEVHHLAATALGNSIGTRGKPLTARVVAVSSFEELEKRKDEVKGSFVFYNAAFDATDVWPGASYGKQGLYRYKGASVAAQYGALGSIIRSLSGGTDNRPHTGMMKYNDSFPRIPAMAIGLQDADYLWQECKLHKGVQVTMKTNAHFLPDTIAHNIIGEFKGSDHADEYITVGGHLDSWDINEGAHDDGTGVVQTIEILRALKVLGYHPHHTLRFVLFANEENGLKGGEKYAELAKKNNERHLLAIETDAGGFTPRGFSVSVSEDSLAGLQKRSELLKPYGGSSITKGGGGADLRALHEKLGVPIGNFLPDSQRYFDVHHAKGGDVFETVNKRELLLGAVNIAAFIYLIDQYGL